ncbi:MAG: hypothetical protein M1823_003816 [Watsoniomyces obsoletus]|nr:MAG: hypothetical protein M1823_003816 [Watsoniomyces obsoletus]
MAPRRPTEISETRRPWTRSRTTEVTKIKKRSNQPKTIKTTKAREVIKTNKSWTDRSSPSPPPPPPPHPLTSATSINLTRYPFNLLYRRRKGCTTARQWERGLHQTLRMKKGAEVLHSPPGTVTRSQCGNVIVEQFHHLDLDELVRETRPKHSDEYAYQMLNEANKYVVIPPKHTYVAMDSKGRRLIVVFPSGLEEEYGPGTSHPGDTHDDGSLHSSMAEVVRGNIEWFMTQCKPREPNNSRHSHNKQWKASFPDTRPNGFFQWGLWFEQGHTQNGPVVSQDAVAKSRTVGALRELLQWLGNVTRAIHMLFGAVDNQARDSYCDAFRRIPSSHAQSMQTDPIDLFTLRVLLVNTWTQPHQDSNDWEGGWAWIAALGDFVEGDFCVTQLRRRIPLPPGAVLGIRGGALEHWTTHWQGPCRYNIRPCPLTMSKRLQELKWCCC